MKCFRFVIAIGTAIAFAGLLAGSASADGGQTATNESISFQGGYAHSGDAYAGFGFASSGDAKVENDLKVEQSIKQKAPDCRCGQDAWNASLSDQYGQADSGTAGAFFGVAKTGDAKVENEAKVEQKISQKVRGFFFLP